MTMIKQAVHLCLLMCLLSSTPSWSQLKDACLWSSAEIKLSPIKKGVIYTSFGYRINENLRANESILAETGIRYKLNDYFRISVEYRFLKKNIRSDNYYATRHRYTGEFKIEYPFKQLEIDVSLKYQLNQFDKIEHEWGNTKVLGRNRDKITLSYRFNKIKLKPFIFHEVFFPLFKTSNFIIDTQRTGFGIEYALNKKHSLKWVYFIENEKTNSNRYRNYINLLGYEFELN